MFNIFRCPFFACWLVALVCAATASDQPHRVERSAPATVTIPGLVKLVKTLEAKVNQLMDDRIMLLRGRDGRDGRDGPKGVPGQRGDSGPPGVKGDRAGGVQYVRWGRTTCPSSAELVYKGRMAGEHYKHTGGGVNYLCLVENPVFANYKDGHQAGGQLYTTEYEVSDFNPFPKNLHDHDAPCAVCYVNTRSTKLMIPGTNVCPAGWTRDYYGYLMTEHRTHPHPRDFICMDKEPEAITGSHVDTNGALLYTVGGVCGYGVPCGPYVAGREITCAICTK